ncbi:DUF2851 family protein [Parabacteroides sp. PF5-9]|uniref:DUF2851 family protein n=1 Tax=Parabacteroides sp. PF5-9 TaxID=1742404 RepID=UPI0024748416|nr:DUF2851 family protein [Parabacteroides sp. PF5-9]MDH6357683.1 hypothetical protein [Parabacteroides sp. PF5-9]
MERLLHYVWKYKLYPSQELTTTLGIPFTVIDPGLPNTDAGPDFFNAKIKINDTIWAGCIEIHENASDWYRHHHDINKAYDSVILHVTGHDDSEVYRTNGEQIPQAVLPVSETIRRNIEWLLHQDKPIPCLSVIKEIDSFYLSGWLDALRSERLERKMQDIFHLLEQYSDDWNEVFYIILTRNFGFGVNSDAFEWLARSLPLRCILKQRNSHSQVEALLFGQAGLLEDEENCYYYRLLQREYRFLRKKFNLTPLEQSLFKNLRIRPGNFPHVKIAQLATILMQHDTLFSALLEASTPREIKDYFRVHPSDYWKRHYHFKNFSPENEKKISENMLNILLINTVIPMFFSWGRKKNRPEYCDRAIRLLESIPPERNSIITTFTQAGISVHNAGDTQALIQLKREYCEKKKCLYCRIGFRFLKRCIPVSS